MLMLTRRSGEEILLQIDGREVARIMVQNCVHGTTQVGIDAVPEMKIMRSELCQATGGTDSEPQERE